MGRRDVGCDRLDSEFDHVRGEILQKDPKLDLESTYAYVRREDQQKQTMGGSRHISESSLCWLIKLDKDHLWAL